MAYLCWLGVRALRATRRRATDALEPTTSLPATTNIGPSPRPWPSGLRDLARPISRTKAVKQMFGHACAAMTLQVYAGS
jgi:hypothetical protein